MVSGRWRLLLVSTLPLFVIAAFLVLFPHPPGSVRTSTYHSLAGLQTHPSKTRVNDIYGDDYYGQGHYVTLPQGRTRYWLVGPEDGHKVVLIHGLSIPSLVYKNVIPILAQNGYRMLIYDLYGRGWSDAPKASYDASLYSTQLALLLQHVRWEKADVVGLSMGAAIAVAFTELFPYLMGDKLALVAPAGLLESTDIPRTVKFMSSPLVQHITSSYPFRAYVRYLAAQQAPEDSLQEIVRIQSAHLPGYNAALASSLRLGPVRGLLSSYQNLGANTSNTKPSVLVLHGTNDKTVPFAHALRITDELVPQAKLVAFEGGSHNFIVSDAKRAASELIRFLN